MEPELALRDRAAKHKQGVTASEYPGRIQQTQVMFSSPYNSMPSVHRFSGSMCGSLHSARDAHPH